jgi:hypothetical protein
MLEIFIIVWLWKKIGAMFQPAGKNPVGYRLLMIVLWFCSEFVGAAVGHLITGSDTSTVPSFNAVVYLFALVGAAFGGTFSYFFIKAVAEKKYPGLVILAYVELSVWLISIFVLSKWISYDLFQYYGFLANLHELIAIGIPILTMPLIAYGFVRLHYWLGFVLGISVSSFIVLNTIAMKLLAQFYGYDSSWTKVILPILIITLLLTKYKNAFASSAHTNDGLLKMSGVG